MVNLSEKYIKKIYKSNFKLLIIFLIFIIKSKIFLSISSFYTIPTINNRYYMINSLRIIFYNNIESRPDIKHNFTDQQKITTEEEAQMISYGRFYGSATANLLIIKDYIYAISDTGSIFCNQQIGLLSGTLSELISLKCDSLCYYVIGIISTNNKISLYLYENNPTSGCSSTVISSKEYDLYVSSDNLSCHYDGNIIICFYGYNSELIASSFSIDINSKNIESTNSYNKLLNVNVKVIRSLPSSDYSKYLVCYIDDEKNGYCIKFDKNSYQWSDSINYLSNCIVKPTSLKLRYFDSLNYYILSCFQSSNEFSYIKLDDNFDILNEDDNGNYYLDESSINDCTEYSLASLVNDTESNVIKIFGICDSTINKYEIQKKQNIMSTLVKTPTTIFTTIPTTTVQTQFTTTNQNELIIIQQKSTKTKEEMLYNIDEIILNYDIGKIYEIFGNDYNIKISPINSNEYKNISTYIDFSNCENILREENKLSSSSILTVYQIEILNNNDQSLINNIEYAVFDENLKRLNLLACENEIIEINYQINTSMINMTKVNYYSNLGIDILNIKDDFFNDICYPYSERDSDMILKDRVSDIYENYSVCENNCEYNGINLTENTVSCKCNIKIEVEQEIQTPKLEEIIRNSFTDSNLGVILCYNLVFDFTDKKNNLGFIIFSCLILIHIPIFIHYLIFNITSIKKYIVSEMNTFGYWCNAINPTKRKKEKLNNKEEKKNKLKKRKTIINLMKGNGVESKENSSVLKINKKYSSIRNKSNKIFTTYTNLNPLLTANKQLNKKNINRQTENDNNNFFRSPIVLCDYKILNKNYIKVQNENNNRNNTMNNNENKGKKISERRYSLIQIDANNSIISKRPFESHIILDNYEYEVAIKYDKRSFWKILYICILAKENIINILFFRTPLDLQTVRICLFIFVYSCDLAFNTIFYSNESISDKYHYEGDNLFLFTMINNIIQSVISSIISIILLNIFQHLIDTRGDFEDIFKEEEQKLRNDKNYKTNKVTKLKILEQLSKIYIKLKYKIIFFFVLEFLTMIFFYYFVTAFCEVYKETQKSWLYDFFTSFLISFVTEIFGALVLAIFYIISIRYKLKFLYKVVVFFYNL